MNKAKLPPFLQRTPEQVAADEQAQAALRASFTRAQLTDGERLLARGMQLEELARLNIAHMEVQREQGFNRRAWGGATLDMLAQQQTILAHALELQGRYQEAANVAPLKGEQRRLRAIHEAVEAPDEMCDCPRESHEVSGTRIEISPRRVLKMIASRNPKHAGREVALMRCDKCERFFALPLTGQAAQIQAARVDAKSGVRVQPDAHILKA